MDIAELLAFQLKQSVGFTFIGGASAHD
jgi:hypothetical protein